VTAAHAPRPARPSGAAVWGRPRAVAGWSFAAVDTAVTLAEEFITTTLRRWRLGELAVAARAVAGALVRRAVVTTGRPGPLPCHLDTGALHGLGEVTLWVRRDGPQRLRVAVWDQNPHGPSDGQADAHLATVNRESRGRWAWYRAHGGGKVIWADIIN
jgi:hypothetical protein